MKNITYYRVTEADTDNFSQYGDTVAVESKVDTDLIYNLTTGKIYTASNEKLDKIAGISMFPLLDVERFNKQAWNL